MSGLRIGDLNPATHRVVHKGRAAGVSMVDVERFQTDASGPAELTVRAYAHRVLDDDTVVSQSFGDFLLEPPFPDWIAGVVRGAVGGLIGDFGVPAGVVPDLSSPDGFATWSKAVEDLLASAAAEWEEAYAWRADLQTKGLPIEEYRRVERRVELLEKRLRAVRRIRDELRDAEPVPALR